MAREISLSDGFSLEEPEDDHKKQLDSAMKLELECLNASSSQVDEPSQIDDPSLFPFQAGFDLNVAEEPEVAHPDGGGGFEWKDEDFFHCIDDDAGRWQPGFNVGNFIQRVNSPLSEQCQVIISNVYSSLQRLPTKSVKALCNMLLPLEVAREVRPWALQATAQLTRVAGNTIGTVWNKLRSQSWEPRPVAGPSARASNNHKDSDDVVFKRKSDDILRLLTIEVVANASAGLTDAHLLRSLQRAKLSGADVGDKFHSPEFFRLTEYLACRCVKALDALELQAALPALGVPSHFSLMWDGVNLGATSFARHESLEVVAISFVNQTGQLHARLLAAPSSGLDRSGQSIAELIKHTLQVHEADINAQVCKSRLASLGGDGAVTRGGPKAKHSSTSAAEKLWTLLGRTDEPSIHWDPYHRDEAARRHAFAEVPMVAELLDLSAVMSQLLLDYLYRTFIRTFAFYSIVY